jgi:hypothetical protein
LSKFLAILHFKALHRSGFPVEGRCVFALTFIAQSLVGGRENLIAAL